MMAIIHCGMPTINVNLHVNDNVAAKNIIHWGSSKRKLPILAAAGAASVWWPQQQMDMEYMERECGVSCREIGDDCCVMSMALDNGGSSAKLMLPSGLITSFKAEMWHGATMELLHTSVVTSAAADNGGAIDNNGGGAAPLPLIQGGLSLALSCHNDDGISWSPNSWALHQVSGTPQDSIQIELISTSEHQQVVDDAQVKHIITLGRDFLTSEIIVTNSSTSSCLHLTGSAICHLAVSTPDATYAIGLQGSDFFIRPPFVPNSTIIIPPDFMTIDQDPAKPWPFNKLFARNSNVEDDVDCLVRQSQPDEGEEEDDNYKHLTDKLCRIYTSAPRNLGIIDRGRRNSVTVGRNGFKEVYMLSPGSEHEWYNNYSYICIGNAALLEPIILKPQTEWRGGLQLWNPNS